MSIVWCCATKVSRRPPVTNVACTAKTGTESAADSSALPGMVLRGAMIDSSSMLMGNLDCLRVSIDGVEASYLRSFRTRRGSLSKDLILEMPELPWPAPSLTTLPASHGKLVDNP